MAKKKRQKPPQKNSGSQANQPAKKQDHGSAKVKLRFSQMQKSFASIIIIMAGILLFTGISNNKFWDDESNTALFARNIINKGELTGWDGTNLIGFRQAKELNENLNNVYMPPLQYYAAALSMTIFGQTTLGGRFLFALMGLISIALLAFWAIKLTKNINIALASAALLALTPSYLMYMRQCRYYALAAMLSMLLLVAWSLRNNSKQQTILRYGLGISASILLLFTNYLNAAAIFAFLPVLFLLKDYRQKQHYQFLGTIYATALVCGVYILLTANPFDANVAPPDKVPAIKRFFTLVYWHIKGLGGFEFMPIGLVFLLPLPWFIKKLRPMKSQARLALILFAGMLVYIITTAIFSPQPVSMTRVADMRYIVPLMAIGSVIAAIVWDTIFKRNNIAASVLGLILIFSNTFSLAYIDKRPFSCTLCEYVQENLNDYTTSTEAIIEHMQQKPAGSVVQVQPGYMAYPLMFYAPKLHICCQISLKKDIAPTLKRSLPDYLFVERAKPDFFVFAGRQPRQVSSMLNKHFGYGRYQLDRYIQTYWKDMTRPDLLWHSFDPPAKELGKQRGISVFKRSP